MSLHTHRNSNWKLIHSADKILLKIVIQEYCISLIYIRALEKAGGNAISAQEKYRGESEQVDQAILIAFLFKQN